VAALPIHGAYAEYVSLPAREFVPLPDGLDPAETVSLILNYTTAYQMLHRTAKVRTGERVLAHGAAGGVGSALLQLARVARLETYGTCSERDMEAVRELGATPIDYQRQDFVDEIRRLTGQGVDAVFDGIGGGHIWESRKALRPVGHGRAVASTGLAEDLSGQCPPRRSATSTLRRRVAVGNVPIRRERPGGEAAPHTPFLPGG
jgi:NADPH:quinone reductase-like Zn-dependent oxidoreductase